MTNQNKQPTPADAENEKRKTEPVPERGAQDHASTPEISVEEMRQYGQQQRTDSKAGRNRSDSSMTINFGDKESGSERQGNTIGRSLSTKIETGLSFSKTSQIDIKGSESKSTESREFRWQRAGAPGLDAEKLKMASKNFLGMPLPFQQAKKSEFKKDLSEEEQKLISVSINNFLTETAPRENEGLSPAERQQLTRDRQAIEQSTDLLETLSNALHLARLYQHLRYIEEAKKAVQLALTIDPDNTLGKQLFNELERMHPIDLGAVSFAAPSGEALLKKSQLRKRILDFSRGRVIVLGDMLIDELVEGKPVRISREAPVLILEHADTELICGGAANTAHNITALGGACHAIGICGKDEYAPKLAHILEASGISHGLVEDPSRPTTVKTRILSKNHAQLQQLLRLDRISHKETTAAISQALVQKLQSVAKDYQAVILSDYRAGVITNAVIEGCRELVKTHNLMVVVDAQEAFERFKGFSLMTPNQPDTEQAVGFQINDKEDLVRAGEKILTETGIQALLVTRGAEGMVLFQKDQAMVELPAFNRSDVFDVTGAGDTVVATMCLSLVSGASYVEAMALGNLAAGIVVRKSGTAVTSQRELLQNLESLDIPE
ncbi:MAG TPA: bifunctional ADP-heptose synthase [Oculatellaceae cyanobacterium]